MMKSSKSTDHRILEQMVECALSGKGAHVEAMSALQELDWKIAGKQPESASNSIYQVRKLLGAWPPPSGGLSW